MICVALISVLLLCVGVDGDLAVGGCCQSGPVLAGGGLSGDSFKGWWHQCRVVGRQVSECAKENALAPQGTLALRGGDIALSPAHRGCRALFELQVHEDILRGNECAAIVGSHAALGSWDPDGAVLMEKFEEGKKVLWRAEVDLPAGLEISYKYVVFQASQNQLMSSRQDSVPKVDRAFLWENFIGNRVVDVMQEGAVRVISEVFNSWHRVKDEYYSPGVYETGPMEDAGENPLLKGAIAIVSSVSPDSPAAEAGLLPGHAITRLGSVRAKHVTKDGIARIVDEVGKHEGKKLLLEVVAPDGTRHKFTLRPRRWSGDGLLGCLLTEHVTAQTFESFGGPPEVFEEAISGITVTVAGIAKLAVQSVGLVANGASAPVRIAGALCRDNLLKPLLSIKGQGDGEAYEGDTSTDKQPGPMLPFEKGHVTLIFLPAILSYAVAAALGNAGPIEPVLELSSALTGVVGGASSALTSAVGGASSALAGAAGGVLSELPSVLAGASALAVKGLAGAVKGVLSVPASLIKNRKQRIRKIGDLKGHRIDPTLKSRNEVPWWAWW